jgi:hypothetical protein
MPRTSIRPERIERRGRLIEKHQFRIVYQRLCQTDALKHALWRNRQVDAVHAQTSPTSASTSGMRRPPRVSRHPAQACVQVEKLSSL